MDALYSLVCRMKTVQVLIAKLNIAIQMEFVEQVKQLSLIFPTFQLTLIQLIQIQLTLSQLTPSQLNQITQ